MRITDLIQRERNITESQYKKLLSSSIKTVKCDRDGWDFSDHEHTTANEALKWVHSQRLRRKYERATGIESLIGILVIHLVSPGDDLEEPDWPEELQPYKNKVDSTLEAYFCRKFDIPCE